MPTILVVNGFRFFFYSNETKEPVHVHIEKGEGNGKIWLEPKLSVAYLFSFSPAEEKEIMFIVNEQVAAFKSKWYEYFGK